MKAPDVLNVLINVFLVSLLVLILTCPMTNGDCGGCDACTKQYGCMTPAWGQCCTQFYMHNGKKRSSGYNQRNMVDRVIEYIRLRSQEIVEPEKALARSRFRRPP